MASPARADDLARRERRDSNTTNESAVSSSADDDNERPTRRDLRRRRPTRRLSAIRLARAQPAPDIQKLWEEHSRPEPADKMHVVSSVIRHATTTLARTSDNMGNVATYEACAHSVRDRLISMWNDTQLHHTREDPKRVYYLSLEFLLGRSLDNALLALNIKPTYSDGMKTLGFNMEDLIVSEHDAGLGNGGLGRLAACYLDSLAACGFPAWGYGLRYTYGIFQQRIIDGYQVEVPDYWLNFDNPWEIPRHDVTYEVRFYGEVRKIMDPAWPGNFKYTIHGGEVVRAMAYDLPIPSVDGKTCISIRLWGSKPKQAFDLGAFNRGDYAKSVEEQIRASEITSVLYPNDNHAVGKELRLRQQYFFVCATLQDIIRRFRKAGHEWDDLPGHVAIQLNDTHPSLAIVELMHVLVDFEVRQICLCFHLPC